MKEKMTFNLLTVMGKVKTDSLEATRELHNQTAGDPNGVAAAKSLGDMSHMAYMPLDAATNFNGDLLFLDIWNSIQGLEQFFSDPQVQAGGNMLFASRTATVWTKLDAFLNFNFPAPYGQNDRYVGLIFGKVNSISEAEGIHNRAMESLVKDSRAHGMVSHDFYARMAAPGSREALEVLGVDVWSDKAAMMKRYSSEDFQKSGLYSMFSEKPSSSIWVHPTGHWVEW